MKILENYNDFVENSIWDDFHILKSNNPKNPQLIYEREPDMDTLNRLIFDLEPNSNILDLGSGDGIDAIYFASKGFNITALDISEVAVNELKQKSPNIDCRVYDIKSANIPYPDEYFDLIYSRLSLHYFDRYDLNLIIHNIKSKLKKGGVLYITSKTQTFEDKIKTGKKFLHKKEWIKVLSNYFEDIHVVDHVGKLYNIPSTWLEIECYKL